MELIRGDTGKYYFTRKDASGNVITSTPRALYFTVKKSYNDTNFLFQKTLTNMTKDEDGTYHFEITPEDTNGLKYGTYYWDIEVIETDYKQTIGRGTFNFVWEITWENNE